MRVVEIILPEGLKSISEKEKDHSFNSLHWTMEDSDGSERSIPTKPSNTSADEELLLQRKEERHGRNPSGGSSGCTSGHASVSSSLTSGTQMSSDSGTEVDQRPPSPDGVFEESSGWEASSLRQRNVSSLRGDPYLKMGKNSANGSGSVARSTPNLTDLEAVGVNASGQGCCGLGTGSSSTGYISMPSSEEMGSGTIPANIIDDGYCCLGLDESSRPLEDVKSPLQQSHASKGYVSLSNVMKTISSPILSPQHHQPMHTIQPVSPVHTSQPTGYVTNVPSRPSSQELSPTKEYVMSGDISDLGSDRRNSPSKFLFEEDEDGLNINFELENDADSYSSYELRGTESLDDLTNLEAETLGTEKELPKSNVGYVTFTEPTSNINLISKSSGITGGSSGYVPHKQFNKEDILSLAQTTTSNKDLKEPCTKVFPPSGRIPKSPTNV
uniref:Uncharacterized protein n=1 Tax=Timema genevievae TaxID=629358 RepID=A0A7R9K7A4_TIMGE|nr:unnamed protein product [Timema genevievae]